MKQTMIAFLWDDITRIFGPAVASNPQLKLHNPKLIESDFGKPDAHCMGNLYIGS